MSADPNCIFCKIVAGQIPSRKVHEDDEVLVFHDIAPWAPVHLLMIPKEHVPTMYEMTPSHAPLLAALRQTLPRLKAARDLDADEVRIEPDEDGGEGGGLLHERLAIATRVPAVVARKVPRTSTRQVAAG